MASEEEASFTVEYHIEAKILINRLHGYPRLPDIVESMLAIRARAEYHLEIPVVWDFRDANLRGVDTEQIKLFRSAMAGVEDAARPVPLGLVTERMTDYGILRQIIGTVGWDDQAYNIYDNVEDAIEWIQSARTDI